MFFSSETTNSKGNDTVHIFAKSKLNAGSKLILNSTGKSQRCLYFRIVFTIFGKSNVTLIIFHDDDNIAILLLSLNMVIILITTFKIKICRIGQAFLQMLYNHTSNPPAGLAMLVFSPFTHEDGVQSICEPPS